MRWLCIYVRSLSVRLSVSTYQCIALQAPKASIIKSEHVAVSATSRGIRVAISAPEALEFTVKHWAFLVWVPREHTVKERHLKRGFKYTITMEEVRAGDWEIGCKMGINAGKVAFRIE